MSVEEAGEEILLGPTEDCPKCQGYGYKADGNGANVFNICSGCRGHGCTVRRAYLKACSVLCVEPQGSKFKISPVSIHDT